MLTLKPRKSGISSNKPMRWSIQIAKDQSQIRGELTQINERLASLENRMTALETRMSNLESRVGKEIRDVFKWLIGMMIPVWIGLIAALVIQFLRTG